MSASNTPNDGTYDDISATVIVCDAVMIFFAALAVLLRFHVRGQLLRTLKIEDWLILVSLVSRQQWTHPHGLGQRER